MTQESLGIIVLSLDLSLWLETSFIFGDREMTTQLETPWAFHIAVKISTNVIGSKMDGEI
mgnify:CR=1 FL=1